MTARPVATPLAALLGVVALVGVAAAQPSPTTPAAAPAGEPLLEIDDCKPLELGKDEIFKQGSEHYERGETLYVQGDYEGAVRELVYSYCLVPSFYTILKDIGQAYERNLDYERAIAYLERYIRAVPANARRANDCASDPQQDKLNVARRIEVLKKLRAKLSVESSPPGAHITIGNADGIAARATSGEPIEVLGGRYDMVIELDGYEPHRQTIEVRIGKPYTYFVPLVALKGRLALRVTPADARVFICDRLAGIGHVDLALEGNTYDITSEAPDHLTDHRRVEILANQTQRVQIELALRPQLGRRQLIVFATLTGGAATAGLLSAFENNALVGVGSLVGAGAGLAGSALFLPDNLALPTSNLTITSPLAGGIAGAGASLLFTRRGEVIQPVVGASVALGGALGYMLGNGTKLTTGDAALINSGVVWGSVAGGLFALAHEFVSLESVYWRASGEPIMMTLLGGAGTVFGPMLGAGVVLFLRDHLSTVTDSGNLVLGVTFVVIVMLFRRGILGEVLHRVLAKTSAWSMRSERGFSEPSEAVSSSDQSGLH